MTFSFNIPEWALWTVGVVGFCLLMFGISSKLTKEIGPSVGFSCISTILFTCCMGAYFDKKESKKLYEEIRQKQQQVFDSLPVEWKVPIEQISSSSYSEFKCEGLKKFLSTGTELPKINMEQADLLVERFRSCGNDIKSIIFPHITFDAGVNLGD